MQGTQGKLVAPFCRNDLINSCLISQSFKFQVHLLIFLLFISKNLFGSNHSGLLSKPEESDDTDTNTANQRSIQKLDFTTLKTVVLFKNEGLE